MGQKSINFYTVEAEKIKRWRCGVSIPVPLACKANALPSELHPHTNKNKKGIEYPDESTKKKKKKF